MAAVAGTAAFVFGGSAGAQPAAAASSKPASQCFYSHDWESWKATPDSKAIYIRVGINRFYRIDFSDSCPTLNAPNVHLVTRSVNDLVCSAIDLDIKVADSPGFPVPCIVNAITPMSPADVAALPKKLKP
jgi:hypothetical protein